MYLPVQFSDVLVARDRIKPFVHRTPVLTCGSIDKLAGENLKVFFKCENLQKTGAFKARGATNAVLKAKLEGKIPPQGVVTYSSGNHGIAISRICGHLKIPCTVVLPKGVPAVKWRRISEYGAELVHCVTDDFEEKIRLCEDRKDSLFIKTADNEDVIAGQGTVGLEMMEQIEPPLDAIVVPLSGGGLISGVAVAVKEMNPDCKIIAVAPKGKDLEADLTAGERNPAMKYLNTEAAAIRGKTVGKLNFVIMNELIEKTVIEVTDEEMLMGMRLMGERAKMVVEMAAGAPVAALLRLRKYFPEVKRCGVILSGGNVDFNDLFKNIQSCP